MSVPTVRFCVNNKRVATAVYTKKGDFLQVYPEKKVFPSEKAWQTHWESVSRLTFTVKDDETKPKLRRIQEEDWTHENTLKFTAPAGEYYIGDLCYVLGEDVYETIFGGLGGYDSGLYKEKGSEKFFLVDNTAHGDGLYYATDGKEFGVDAGIIGICPKSVCKKNDGGGQFYTFEDPVRCKFGGGKFEFRSGHIQLVIDTAGSNEDDEEYE
jgi:hypothetical protein